MAASLDIEGTQDLLSVSTLAQRTSSVLERLRDSARSARADERREPTFPIGKAAELVGRTAAAIREAEKDGRLPPPPRTENNRRVGYTLAQLNDMRGLFGTRPWRAATDPCCVIAVQNFKGGVGKSTLSVHLAQYLAIKGYRVALIDCDSQASATTLFGYVPHLDLTEEDPLSCCSCSHRGSSADPPTGMRSRRRPRRPRGPLPRARRLLWGSASSQR